MPERTKIEPGDVRNLTPQRFAVLEVIRENRDHLTAGEIFIEARKRLGTISYATVYNSLHYLKEAGLVREIQFGNGASRYDREIERHDHAICVHCGKLVDFDLPLGPDLVTAAAERTSFIPESIHLTLRGTCADCGPGECE
ncbi:MAG: Fur family transcriptional regulator, peroxide stress response regulator [Blastocatellia bacterium]|jgi:Fur family peroxide stress response transcriptional regulator|nr:Fur family transcriptional regulator, peroxide stress response regulator [Blastocatellia bacterium]